MDFARPPATSGDQAQGRPPPIPPPLSTSPGRASGRHSAERQERGERSRDLMVGALFRESVLEIARARRRHRGPPAAGAGGPVADHSGSATAWCHTPRHGSGKYRSRGARAYCSSVGPRPGPRRRSRLRRAGDRRAAAAASRWPRPTRAAARPTARGVRPASPADRCSPPERFAAWCRGLPVRQVYCCVVPGASLGSAPGLGRLGGRTGRRRGLRHPARPRFLPGRSSQGPAGRRSPAEDARRTQSWLLPIVAVS